MKRQFRHTRRGYPPTCCWGGIHRSATAFYRIHPRLKKPWYSAKADKNESMRTAAKRELLEETGYKAGKIVKLLTGPVSSGFTADIVTVVRAYGLRKVARGGGDHTENIVVHEVPLAKAEHWLKQMARKGCLIEPKVYAGLFFLTKEIRR